MPYASRFTAVLATALLSLPVSALACCLTDKERAMQFGSVGLGERAPPTPDLSHDPAWRVHAFSRDGIEYFQINEPNGRVVAIIGRSETTFWLLPAGSGAMNVSLPGRRLPIAAAASSREIYRHPAFSLTTYAGDNGTVWSVELADSDS